VDDDVVSALEELVADLGTLLVQMDKFRAARTTDAHALRADALAVADRARRAHRHGTLTAPVAESLATEARSAHRALRTWLDGVRAASSYRAAVAALAAGDRAALGPALVEVYDGASIAPPPPALHLAVPWQRRGRPRPAGEIAADVAVLRAEGAPAERDPEGAGVDPELPAVALLRAPPPGAPVSLVLRGAALPAWVLVLAASDDVFVPGKRLLAAFDAMLASPGDELDEWVLEPARFLAELRAELTARAIPIVP
jgi:hypothetical protein